MIRFYLTFSLLALLSITLGYQRPVTGFVVFGVSIYWLVAAAYRFKVPKVRLGISVWGVMVAGAAAFGYVRTLMPPPAGHWKFSPATSAVLSAIVVGVYLGLWILLSYIIMLSVGHQPPPRPPANDKRLDSV